jgi:hypothetical protein
MSDAIATIAWIPGACPFCSNGTAHQVLHGGPCPAVKSLDRYSDGSIKRIEFNTPPDIFWSISSLESRAVAVLKKMARRATGLPLTLAVVFREHLDSGLLTTDEADVWRAVFRDDPSGFKDPK